MNKICFLSAFPALLCSVVLLAFTTCSDPLNGEAGKDASFSITINGGGGRAVLPHRWNDIIIAELVHTITMTNSSGLSITL